MAFPETDSPKRNPYGDPKRDPTGTDPHSQTSNWSWIFGVALAALLGFFLINSMYVAPKPVSDTSTSQRVEPKTAPEPAKPNPQPN